MTRVIEGKKLPRLSSLTLSGFGIQSNDLVKLVGQLVRSYFEKFGCLRLCRLWEQIAPTDARCIGEHLGYWSGLKELHLHNVRGGGSVLQRFSDVYDGDGLQSLPVIGLVFGLASFRSFFHALRGGSFQGLTSLSFGADTAAVGRFIVQDLADALVGLAALDIP